MNKVERFLEAVLLVFLPANVAQSQVQYGLIVDDTSSTIVGAENRITLHRGISAVENRYLKAHWFDESGPQFSGIATAIQLLQQEPTEGALVNHASLMG